MASSSEKKSKLLEIASMGNQKPSPGSPLGIALGSYTNPKGKLYDRSFVDKIKKHTPFWFKDLKR